jgi:uroporphyrin-III C-methyltransferase
MPRRARSPDLDWQALARPNQTVVVFMGVGTAGMIAARLVAAGVRSCDAQLLSSKTHAGERDQRCWFARKCR